MMITKMSVGPSITPLEGDTYGIMEFSAKLKKLLVEHRYSQEDLAEELGVSQSKVSWWVQAKGYPNIKEATILARIFGVDVDYLACDAAERPRSLSEDERTILEAYRTLRDERRLTRQDAVHALYGAAPKVAVPTPLHTYSEEESRRILEEIPTVDSDWQHGGSSPGSQKKPRQRGKG